MYNSLIHCKHKFRILSIKYTTKPHNATSKLAFLKEAFYHPHFATSTLLTYHNLGHQYRSCPMLMTSPSHLHTQAWVEPRHTSNYTKNTAPISSPTYMHHKPHTSTMAQKTPTFHNIPQTFPQIHALSLQRIYKQTCALYTHPLSPST